MYDSAIEMKKLSYTVETHNISGLTDKVEKKTEVFS